MSSLSVKHYGQIELDNNDDDNDDDMQYFPPHVWIISLWHSPSHDNIL